MRRTLSPRGAVATTTAALASLALLMAGCAADDADEEPMGSQSSNVSLGSTTLTSAQERWIAHVDNEVVSRLPGASQQEKARTAAIVVWWALKEGVLDVAPNPWRHNLCTQGGGDVQIGDTGVCNGPAWQVGLSGIQVNNVSTQQVESAAQRIYPNESMPTILARIAKTAGVTSTTASTVANSTGSLRKSWLLRDPAISISLQRAFVEGECLQNSYSWCFGGWEQARAFASSSTRIRQVIGELEQRFMTAGGSSSGSTTPTPTTPPQQAKRCPLGNGLYCGGNYVQGDSKTLYNCNEATGLTVRQVCARGCQRMPDGENDRCAL